MLSKTIHHNNNNIYNNIDSNVLVYGDCFDVLPNITEKVHAVITDPPYDYDQSAMGIGWNQEEINKRLKLAKEKGYGIQHLPYGNSRRGGKRDIEWFKNEQVHIKEYIEFTKKWSSYCYSLLHGGGYIAVCCKNTSISHIQLALEEVGFYTKEIIILVKPSNIRKGVSLHQVKTRRNIPSCETEKYLCTVTNNLTEFVVLAHKPFDENISSYLDQYLLTGTGFIDNRFISSNLFNYKKEKVSEDFNHINRKPLSTMESLVLGLTKKNQIIIDPFMGSGTTGIASINNNRIFIGIEKQFENFEKSVNRIKFETQNKIERFFD